MASGPNTPARPAARAMPTPPPRPESSAGVLEVELSSPIKMGIANALSSTLRFARPPGLGELDGWLDESTPEAFDGSLMMLPFRPGWQVHVLTRCAGLTVEQAGRVPACDGVLLGRALAGFLSGSRGTGGQPSGSSPSDTGGDQAT